MPGLNDQFAGYEILGEFIHFSFDVEPLRCYHAIAAITKYVVGSLVIVKYFVYFEEYGCFIFFFLTNFLFTALLW